MQWAFMHQITFGTEVPTPSISLFILYTYGPHVSENSGAICKALCRQSHNGRRLLPHLLVIISIVSHTERLSELQMKQHNWCAPHHILAVG